MVPQLEQPLRELLAKEHYYTLLRLVAVAGRGLASTFNKNLKRLRSIFTLALAGVNYYEKIFL